MEMLKKLFAVLVGLMFVAGAAYAATPYTAGDTPQQTDTPKDCKKNPTDPRCKESKEDTFGDVLQQTDTPKDCKKNPTDPRCKEGG